MAAWRLVFIASYGIGLLACGGGSREAGRPAIAGGERRVKNTGPSAWNTPTGGWKLMPERVIHPLPNSAGELVHPGGVVASSTGEIFVLDRKPAVIKEYSPIGAFVRKIGREGSGPGEFRDDGVLYIAHDTLVHQDAGQSRLSTFSVDGTFLRTWISSPIAGRGLIADDSGRVPVPAATGTSQINGGHRLLRFRLDGSIADTITLPDAAEPAAWRLKDAHTDMGMLIPFAPDRVTGFDRAGRLVWGDQARYRLVYSRTGRDTLRVVDAPAVLVPIADSLRQAEFDADTAKYKWLRGVAKLDDVPHDYPAWTDMIADGGNNLWVLRPGPLGSRDHWDVFDPDGRLLGPVAAPFHHVDGTFWTHDRVYVLAEGRDGVPMIQVYRILREQY